MVSSETAGTMDLKIVCGSPDPGGPEYTLGFLLGLVLNAGMWAYHRHLARRPAARQILPIK